jgi:outer membrane receptor protein involved in Fe transport
MLLAFWAGAAESEPVLSTAIAPQPLAAALSEFAHQTGLQLVYVSQIAAGRASKGAPAGLSATEALTQLLEGTGLSFQFLNTRTVRIYESTAVAPASQSSATEAPKPRAERAAAHGPTELEDIVVVGLRDEPGRSISDFVQNVPASVTIVSGETLEAQKLEQLTDYANYVPGLNVADGGSPGQALVILRGVASVTDGSYVAYYLDDVPMGPTSNFGRACCTGLDLTPYDLDRLEVLRGPQGTVYGAEAEAGMIRYVLKVPSVTDFEARVGADSSWVQGGSSSGITVRAMLNAPVIEDVFALRASAYDKYTPGYIYNLYTGAPDVNDVREDGGRIAALWLPAASLSVKINVFWYGVNSASDTSESSMGVVIVPGNAYIGAPAGLYPDLTEDRAFLQPFKKNIELYSSTVKWSPGTMDLVSTTAWSGTDTRYTLDTTPDYSVLSGQTSTLDRQLYLGKFTEELRLVAPPGRRIDWYLGGFYTHESVTDQQNIDDPVYLYHLIEQSFVKEWAAFADLTWRPTAQLDLTAGIRNDHYKIGNGFNSTYENVPDVAPTVVSSSSYTTWMASAGYHWSADVMLYGRVATGNQPGGGGTPRMQNGKPLPPLLPETLRSYEIGVKSQFLDHRLLADLTLFYVIRDDVQLLYGDWGPDFLTNTGTTFSNSINAGNATSQGAELAGFYSPLHGLKFGWSAAYTQSELSTVAEYAGTVKGPIFLSGYQFPNVPKWALSATADYDWMPASAWDAHVGAAFRWVDQVWGATAAVQTLSQAAAPSIVLPAYALLDLNAGMRKGSLALKAFVQNLTNKRAYLGGGVTESVSGSAISIAPVQINYAIAQPRTAGVGFDYGF